MLYIVLDMELFEFLESNAKFTDLSFLSGITIWDMKISSKQFDNFPTWSS